MAKRDTTRFLQKVTAELDRRGYRLVRSLRDVGLCQWLLVRRQKTGELVEVECYDKSITNIMLLIGYRNKIASCGDRYSPDIFRLPIDQAETDRLVFFVRPYIQGEPLYRLLLRPGTMPPRRIHEIILAACNALREVLVVDPRAVPQVFSNLYLTDDGRVYVDSLCVGPWITVSEADRLLKPLTIDGESATATAQAFVCRLAARLYTGVSEPGAALLKETAALHEGRDAAFLNRLADEPGSRFWADAYFEGGRPSFLRRLLLPAVAAVILGTAIWHISQRESPAPEWLGALGQLTTSGSEDAEAGAADDKPAAEDVLSARTAKRLVEAETLARGGKFREALAMLEELRGSEGITDDEYVHIVSARSRVEERMEAEFRYIRNRVDSLRRAGEYSEGLELLEFATKAYPAGRYAEETSGLRTLLIAERRQGIQDRLAEDASARNTLARDLNAFTRLLKRRDSYADSSLVSDLERLAEAAATDNVRDAAAILADIHAAEIRLFKRITDAWRKQKNPDLLAACSQALGKALGDGQRVQDIDSVKMTVITADTVRSVEWQVLEPGAIYEIFRNTQKPLKGGTAYTFDLYLFCLGRQLLGAADELKRLQGTAYEEAAAKAARYPELLKEIVESTE